MSTTGSGAGRHARLGGGGRGDAVTESGDITSMVLAARAGDRQAAEALIAAHLPLLYRVVGRALGSHADVDDVVQETVLRAHRDLPSLRAPESFRSWLIAIAMRQISTRLRQWQHDRDRSASLEDATQVADPDAEFADATLLRLDVSAQRRQVAQAARWLDTDDQELATLWWQEAAGALTRAEVVAALGISSAHARVRIQRMRHQLELSRHVVAALEADPRCPRLTAVADGWDGAPGTRWRKRFARHLRECDQCGAVSSGFIQLERLIIGASLTLLPAAIGSLAAAGLLSGGSSSAGFLSAGSLSGSISGVAATGGATAASAGKTVGGGVAAWFGQFAGAKAVTAVVVSVTVSGGVYLALPEDPPRPPRAIAPAPVPTQSTKSFRTTRPSATPSRPAASPSPAGLVPRGQVLIRPAGQPGTVVALDGNFMVLGAGPGVVVTVSPGITDPKCITMRSADGRYVRHASFQIQLNEDEGRQLFREDATFCPHPGPAAGTIRLTSFNYPDRFVRVLDGRLRLDPGEKTDAYIEQSTFTLTRP
ncbi:sigma-70 family RNA polymerase sigma factor [Actinoplanes sp. GCM10030250]|uniref:sigma-70 family RNA polymerase sigma factor n=1 Tax=Actinoplanes sp. GCM10030250 TaxID=3273376 RepID=UPI0036242971